MTSLERLNLREDYGYGVTYYGYFTELDLSGLASLESVNCSAVYYRNASLTTLNVSGCTALKSLVCNNQQITSLNTSGCTSLQTLYCYKNKLTSISLADLESLKTFLCYDNAVTELDLSTCPQIERVECYNNKLASINVKTCENLKYLYAQNNVLTVLEVSGNPALSELNCSVNSITALEVSKNTSLTKFFCNNNRLTMLDVGGNTSIGQGNYNCSSQNIDGLTVTQNNGKYTVNLRSCLSENVKNVIATSVYGKDSGGKLIEPAYDSGTGIMTFDVSPASVYYDYDTKYGKDDTLRYMGVTIAANASPVITTASVPNGIIDMPYEFEFEADGEKPITWTIEGDIPEGLKVSGGKISGTPSTTGIFTLTVTAANDFGSETKDFMLPINDPVQVIIDTTKWELDGGNLVVEYGSESLTFAPENDGHSFKINGVFPDNLIIHLPANWELDVSDGGKITASDPAKVKLARDVEGLEAPAVKVIGANDITLHEAGLIMTAWSIADTPIKASKTTKWAKENGKLIVETDAGGHYEFEPFDGTNGDGFIISGDFPAGLTLHLPAKWGIDTNKSYDVTVSDTAKIIPASEIPGLPSTAHRILGDNTITLNKPDIVMTAYLFTSPTITTEKNLGTFKAGNNISLQLKAEGTTWKMSWTAEGLPDGLSMNSTGLISGRVTTAETYTFTATATNTAGTNSKQFTLTVRANTPPSKAPVITTRKFPDGYNGKQYSYTLEADGDVDEWQIVSGTLPGGLELNPNTGEIAGEIDAQKTATFRFKIVAVNSEGQSKAVQFSIRANSKDPVFKPDTLKPAKWGSNYNAAIRLSNFKAVTWDINGDLPDGITFVNGRLSGKPQETGEFDFTVTAGNGAAEVEQDFVLVVNGIPPKLKGSLRAGKENTPYTCTLKATGIAPIEWDFENLPDGLDFETDETGGTCTISGTPEDSFSGIVTITITNGAGDGELTKTMKLTIKAAKPKFATRAKDVPGAIVGEDYEFQLKLSEGPVNVDWSYTGNMPEGLYLDDYGLIYGRPTTAGSYRFTVTARHPTQEKLSAKLSITLNVSTLSNSNTAGPEEFLPDFVNGAAYYERGEITADMTARIENNGEIIAAVLPAIEVDDSGVYDFAVSLDQSVPEGGVLVWHSFPDGGNDPDDPDNAYFLDDNDNPIERVPETHSVTVNAWLVPGKVYEPIITVKDFAVILQQ